MSLSYPFSPDQHKRTIRRLYEEVWTNSEFGNLADLIAPEFTFHFRGRTHLQSLGDLIEIIRR